MFNPQRFASFLSVSTAACLLVAAVASAQPGGRGGFGGGAPGGFGGRGGGAPAPDPVAVDLPTEWKLVTGPGPAFNSDPSHLPGHAPSDYGYRTLEYFVSGTANDNPYTTRVVVRRPGDDSDYTGLVLAESMHNSGAAHMFEFTAAYLMDAGHVAVEIVTTSPQQFIDLNADRYSELVIPESEANMILAQVGALLKMDDEIEGGLLDGLGVRNMVLGGTSMSSQTLATYMTEHPVFRTPAMEHIYDGFFPTSNGNDIQRTDVPVIQMPTMHEVEAANAVTRRADGDEPGNQYRLYEYAAIGHVDSRDNFRLLPNPCVNPLSTFPTQAYFSVSLYHLLRWVDEGIVPPRADRIWLDRSTEGDGTLMATDEHGNVIGGIRNPYVDVPVASYHAVNSAADPLPAAVSAYVAANPGFGANIMCRLSAYQLPFDNAALEELYGSPRAYRSAFEQSLDELEDAGWSLPVYRDVILQDAAAVSF